MEALLPLMENASALDWVTLGALAWLGYRDYLQKKRIDAIARDLEKHEDKCIEFRRDMYKRVGSLESQAAALHERTGGKQS